jgi:hypothetical protein
MTTSLHGSANRLIGRRGEALILEQVSAGTYSTTTGGYTGESTTRTAFTGFVGPYTSREINGTSVLLGDLRVVVDGSQLAALSLVPESGNTIERSGGERYRIVSVEDRPINGASLVQMIQIRGAD